MGAGQAVCNCSTPDTCICTIDVVVPSNSKKFTYEQNKKLPTIYLHDKDGKGAKMNVTITPKGCVSKSKDCPKGFLYKQNSYDVLKLIKHTTPVNCTLFYEDIVSDQTKLDNKYNVVFIALSLINNALNGIPQTKYNLAAYECRNKGMVTSRYGNLTLGSHRASESQIVVYPKYSLKIGVMIGLDSATQSLSDAERKNILLAHNRQDNNYNNTHNWHNRVGKNSITHSLSISGFAEYSLGKVTARAETDKLKKQFVKYKNQLTLLNKVETVFDTANKMFAASSTTTPYPIAKVAFLPPNLILSGEGSLALTKTTNEAYMSIKLDVSFKPLVGIQLTIDLIQAFATYYGMQYIVGSIREAGAAGKSKVENGENGAYLEGRFDLIVKGAIDIGFSATFDEKRDVSFKLATNTEASLTITGLADIRAGAKVYFVKAYVDAGGSITAVGCCGLVERKKTAQQAAGLDMVLYHKGITAKFWAEAGFGQRNDTTKKPTTTKTGEGKVITGQTKTSTTANNKGKVEQTWVIAAPLTKSESKHRVRLT